MKSLHVLLSGRLPVLLFAAAGLHAQTVEPGTRTPAMSPGAVILPSPPEILDPEWLPGRAADQMLTRMDFGVETGFRFVDRFTESGIDWVNRVVDDAGRTYEAAHYDHGNSIAAADVDGDGWIDLYLVNQVGSNALYRNRGDGSFEDITAAAGVAVRDRIGVAASFADTDNDGDPDLFVTTVKEGNLFFENLGGGLFRDISRPSGLGHRGHSSGAVFFDFDRDGLLDLFLSNVGEYTSNQYRTVVNDRTTRDLEPGEFGFYSAYPDAFSGHLKPWRAERSILYRNMGDNRFIEVSETVGLLEPGWNGDATPIDVNNDGWIDLYVADMQGHDDLWINQGGERFVKQTDAYFPKTPWGAMGLEVLDWDRDGDLDLFVTDMHSDMSVTVDPDPVLEKQKAAIQYPESYTRSNGKSLWGNAFFENDGRGGYTEISDAIGAETFWPWGLSVGDVNADGWEDIFITGGMNLGFRYGVNSLLLNDRGTRFRDAEFLLGLEPRAEGRTAIPWFEIDVRSERDRDLEMARVALEAKPDVGLVSVWGALASRSSVLFDLEGDGDLDIVTNDFNSEPMVLVSDLSDQLPETTWLKIALVGHRSNRDGLGAVVRVEAGDARLTQVHDGKSGYLSQSSLPLYFGLDRLPMVDRVVVSWPSGREQGVAGPIVANQTLTIEEAQPTSGR